MIHSVKGIKIGNQFEYHGVIFEIEKFINRKKVYGKNKDVSIFEPKFVEAPIKNILVL